MNIMADKVPKFVVIKSVISSGYARYLDETEAVSGYVYCQEKSVFSPFAKIEVESADVNAKYVHLRFYHNNKYWARGADDHWIVAVSDQPEEDTSKSSCTLFEPTFDDEGRLYMTHVRSGRRVRTDSGSNRVYVDDDEGKLNAPAGDYAFSIVDWDTLVKIPKRVAFKGDNDKYLIAVWYDGTPGKDGRPNLQFSGSDGNHGYAAQEVSLHPDGYLRIKSEHFGRFWRLSPDWIWGDSTDENGTDIDTLFWPVKIDGRTVALRNAGNKHFCSRHTAEGKEDCLNAAVSCITKQARLVVQELVLERNIYDVRYRMDDARVFDLQPFVAGIGSACNALDTETSLTIKVAYEDTRSYSFSNSFSIITGVRSTIQAGIPTIVDGKIEISAEATIDSFEWKQKTEVKNVAEATYTVKVPPKTRVRVHYVGTRGKCSVPFSYTQRDQSSNDKSYITTQHIDGVFHGSNYYGFRFEHLAMEPAY